MRAHTHVCLCDSVMPRGPGRFNVVLQEDPRRAHFYNARDAILAKHNPLGLSAKQKSAFLFMRKLLGCYNVIQQGILYYCTRNANNNNRRFCLNYTYNTRIIRCDTRIIRITRIII